MLLRFQEDLDPADIAVVLAMSVNTVKSHLRRSLEWLRAELAGDNDGP
jgi:DNA-directed RNA polymerase specialized sigma24 family protein